MIELKERIVSIIEYFTGSRVIQYVTVIVFNNIVFRFLYNVDPCGLGSLRPYGLRYEYISRDISVFLALGNLVHDVQYLRQTTIS